MLDLDSIYKLGRVERFQFNVKKDSCCLLTRKHSSNNVSTVSWDLEGHESVIALINNTIDTFV